jgi:hypothetical protein
MYLKQQHQQMPENEAICFKADGSRSVTPKATADDEFCCLSKADH